MTWQENFKAWYHDFGKYWNIYKQIRRAWDQIELYVKEHCPGIHSSLQGFQWWFSYLILYFTASTKQKISASHFLLAHIYIIFYIIMHLCILSRTSFFRLDFYLAMLCIRGTSHGPVSVYVSVRLCLSEVEVLLKQLNRGSHKQHHMIAQGV